MPALSRHPYIVRILHITSGLLLIYGMVRNATATDAMESGLGIAIEVVFAVFLGALFAWRYALVRKDPLGGTRLSPSAPRWEKWASRVVHKGSYLLVFGVIGSGLLIAFFATIDAPTALRVSIFAHNGFAHMLMPFIVLHIAGALWHWLVRRDGVWGAMMSLKRNPA